MKRPPPEWRNPTHKELVQMFLRRSALLDAKDAEIQRLSELVLEIMTACTLFWKYVNQYSDPVNDEPAVVKFRDVQRKMRRALGKEPP